MARIVNILNGAYQQPITPQAHGEVGILRVRQWIEALDPLTDFTSMSSYGTATGVVFGFDAVSGAGQILGLNAGALQAYFDSDGKIKWAGGAGVLAQTGMLLLASSNVDDIANARGVRWQADSGVYVDTKARIGAAVGVPADPDVDLGTTVLSLSAVADPFWVNQYAYAKLEARHSDTTVGAYVNVATAHDLAGWVDQVQIYAPDGITLQGETSLASNRITNLGNATADTDALNRQTGDGRYLRQTTNIVTVDADGYGDYLTIGAAVTAINAAGDAAAANPYVIEVWTGVYTENVTLPDYVSLRGQGWKATTLSGALTAGSGAHVEDLTLYAPDPATTTLITNPAVDTNYFTNCYIVVNTSVDGAVYAVRHTGSTDSRFYNCFIYARNPNVGASAKTYVAKHEGTGGDIELQECHLKSSCPHAGSNTLAWNASATAGADIIVLASSWSVFNDATPVGADNDNASGQIKLVLSFENDSDDDGLYSTAGSGIINEVALLNDGTRAGATTQAQTFTNGIIGPTWRPAADSTTALRIFKADAATAVITVNTTDARVGINTAPAAGYDLTLAGNLLSVTTVDQATYANINAAQYASTLQDGSASSGADETLDNLWEALKFTAAGNHNVRSFSVRLKASAALSNPTAILTGYLYTDNSGVPGTLVSGAAYIRYGVLTTSYVEYHFSVTTTLVSGTSYWLVLKQSGAPTGGTISLDRNSSGTALHAYSADGAAWTAEDSKTGWFKLYGRTYAGVQASSVQHYGIYGISTNSYGAVGSSTYGYGVYGTSTHNHAGLFSAAYGAGVYGTSTHNYGVYGTSTNHAGVGGLSTNSHGVYGTSTAGRAGYFYRNSNTATAATLEVHQDHASDTQVVATIRGDGTGDILQVLDGASVTFRIADGGSVGFFGVAAAAQRAHVADANAAYGAGELDTEAEIIAAINAANGKLNSILASLEAFGFHATA